jgi:hypothetical protein
MVRNALIALGVVFIAGGAYYVYTSTSYGPLVVKEEA